MTTTFTGYADQISKATGVTDVKDVQEIEDYMRDIYFHSTLDWLTAEQLNKGALESWYDIQYMRSPEGKAYIKSLTV